MTQLSVSQSGVTDLRSQLASFEASATSAKCVLESEVQIQRAKKRNEDHVRLELKARIKALEEEKRSAEGVKREKEKSLSHTLGKKKEVEKRLEKLLEEARAFMKAIEESADRKGLDEMETDATVKNYEEKVENAKKEIDIAEKVLGQLNERVKEVEDQINEEKVRITEFQEKRLKPEHPMRPHTRRLTEEEVQAPWPPIPAALPKSSPTAADLGAPPMKPKVIKETTSDPTKPRQLSLGGVSNILARRVGEARAHASSLPPANPPTKTAGSAFYSRFSPFDTEQEPAQLSLETSATSPLSPVESISLIPSGIMDTPTTLENGDLFAPVMRGSPSRNEKEESPHEPFGGQSPEVPELRFSYSSNSPEQLSPVPAHQQRYEVFDSQRAIIKPPSRESFFNSTEFTSDPYSLDRTDSSSIKSRRWFSKDKGEATEKESLHKGLNPDAKIFKFTRKSPFLSLGNSGANGTVEVEGRLLDQSPGQIDPLNPSGLPPMPPPPTPRTSFFSSLRAFQPSPAEREALRLAMVSSANNSLERINSSGSHQSGNSYSPPATGTGSPLLHGPFLGSPGSIPRPSNSLPPLLQGQTQSNVGGGFSVRNPWIMSSNHTSTHSLDALATATVQAVNGESLIMGEGSFSSAPPHKKTFSFNPWGGDKLLGGN
jgi:hypothetical protein